MRVLDFIFGTLTVEITSASAERTLDKIVHSGINITNIRRITELTYRFQIRRRDFQNISRILQSRQDKLVVVSKQGLYWKIRSLIYRPILIVTALLLLLLTLYLPTRVLFIEVEGNITLPTSEILLAAERNGISFGVSRKYIRSEKAKNQLLEMLPSLQWAGINTTGCRAVISVRERSDEKTVQTKGIVSNLVAQQDAFILSTSVTGGTAMVKPGDTVIAGQTLISGYADHGFHLSATRAIGEIRGLTTRSLTAVMPGNCLKITEPTKTKWNISLLIRKKRINLWKDSRISDTCCGRMYEEYFVSLPGGFQLPLAVCVDRYICRSYDVYPVAETEAVRNLQHFSDSYLVSQMISGQILEKKQNIETIGDIYLLHSSYTCSEIIGTEQREQIGDHNGKRN